MAHLLKYPLLLIVLCLSIPAAAQEGSRLEIVQGGNYMEGVTLDTMRYTKLIGGPEARVIFSQKTTRIHCDSAYFYRAQNKVEAYGNVRIIEKDTITVTGQRLIYFGNIKLARMIEKVVYKDPGLTIESDTMQYDMINNLASYFHNGKLVDTRNTLTSEIGNYHTVSKLASFKKDVVLVNPDYHVYSDTLQYNTATEIAYFHGPTTIVLKEDSTIIRAQEGEFDTNADQTSFGAGQIETESYVLEGDELFFDDVDKFYYANHNVRLISKEENIIITGDYGRHWKSQGLSKIFGAPVMRKIMEQDTLFLAADTLVSIDHELRENRRLLAYNDVRIFREDMQAIADSLSYHLADSIIYFYHDPVLWQEENQLEADSINIKILDSGIDRMNLNVNSFLISQDTLKNFNQIKGRTMTILFKDNEIHEAYVYGNGESVMYAPDETETYVMGLNKVICSSMTIRFEESLFKNASFYTKPEAWFIPPHEIKPEEKHLAGFNWRNEERPEKKDIFAKPAGPQPSEPDEIIDDTREKIPADVK